MDLKKMYEGYNLIEFFAGDLEHNQVDHIDLYLGVEHLLSKEEKREVLSEIMSDEIEICPFMSSLGDDRVYELMHALDVERGNDNVYDFVWAENADEALEYANCSCSKRYCEDEAEHCPPYPNQLPFLVRADGKIEQVDFTKFTVQLENF